MKFPRLVAIAAAIFMCTNASAQVEEIVNQINEYGKFDRWSRRRIEESFLIGGDTKYLYEFYGDPSKVYSTGKKPFKAPEGYYWRTNNVLAVVCGIVKTNNTVFPEKRGDGYCARLETHIEEVKVLGMINMDVTCQGAIMIGQLPEPITSTSDPMSKVLYGIPFTACPRAIRMDYKADVCHEVIRGTGFSRLKRMGYVDHGEITVILQKRWEDEDGNIHALRVGTAIERITEDIPEWVNGHEMVIEYGDITQKPYYKSYMGLKTNPATAYRALNSKGDVVIIQEEGWAPEGTEPTHFIFNAISSCGEAFYGGVGNTIWLDNIEIVME